MVNVEDHDAHTLSDGKGNNNSTTAVSYGGQTTLLYSSSITGDHSKYDQKSLVKLSKYIGFCMYRRSYLLWSPVIEYPPPPNGTAGLRR